MPSISATERGGSLPIPSAGGEIGIDRVVSPAIGAHDDLSRQDSTFHAAHAEDMFSIIQQDDLRNRDRSWRLTGNTKAHLPSRSARPYRT